MKYETLIEVGGVTLLFAAAMIYGIHRQNEAPPAAQPKTAAAVAPPVLHASPDYKSGGVEVVFSTIDGPLAITFWPKLAPKHVAQFVRLIKAGVFNNSVIFRNEKGFVLQFGGTYERPVPLTPEQQQAVTTIKSEFSDVKHVRGIISAARGDDPDSADTSFSILLGNAPHLDGHYTVFGQMHPESDDTLQKLEAEPVEPGTTKPVRVLTIDKAEVVGG